MMVILEIKILRYMLKKTCVSVTHLIICRQVHTRCYIYICKTMTPRCYEIPTENDVMDLFLTGCRFIDFEDCNGNSHKQTLNDTKFLNLSSDRYFNLLFPYHEKHYQKYFKGKWILSVRLSEFFFF